VGVPEALGPAFVSPDRNPGQTERRQNLRDVTSQRLVEHDDQHSVGSKAARVVVGEVGEAMEADRRFAAAGAALDYDQSGIGPRDELELPRIDERRDLLQMLVFDGLV